MCVCFQLKYQKYLIVLMLWHVSSSTAYGLNAIKCYNLCNWLHTTSTPCCFLKVPVETARALQMSTAGNVLTALTHRQPNKEDKLPLERSRSASFGEDGLFVCSLKTNAWFHVLFLGKSQIFRTFLSPVWVSVTQNGKWLKNNKPLFSYSSYM